VINMVAAASDAFGGSFMYPLERISWRWAGGGARLQDINLDVHSCYSGSNSIRASARIEGGELVEWGAKTIPEGGFYSCRIAIQATAPCYWAIRRLRGRAVAQGDSYAMQSGMYAARVIPALSWRGSSIRRLGEYDGS